MGKFPVLLNRTESYARQQKHLQLQSNVLLILLLGSVRNSNNQ
jgi:hypothetical protein